MSVRFLWPLALFALLIPLAVLAASWWIRRRRRKYAVTFASLSLVKQALPERARWKRLVPAGLLLLAMVALVLATARPQALVSTTRGDTSIMLTIDVSRSMCSTDVQPNRLAAAQEAAHRFIDAQPSGTRMGIVVFAASAQIVVPPTDDHDRLNHAIDHFSTAVGTAIGNGILASIDALARVNAQIAPSTVRLNASGRARDQFASKYVPDVVVLLTDGAATTGVDPRTAARQAADRGVRVFTIGFGTEHPSMLVCTADQFGGDTLDPYGGGGGSGILIPGGGGPGGPGGPGGGANFLQIDEPTLKAIARTTGGTYARAANASQLNQAFAELPKRVVKVRRVDELTVYAAAAGALLAIGALATSRWWNRVV
ncbi:MAG TPA: VWA domain-containing protein [Acidimicrobiia bacterium]|jgi:Ca-activated chloride channel family protein